MPTAKPAAIAAVVIAMWSAGPVLAQSAATSDMSGPVQSEARPGERASAVIRAIESEDANALTGSGVPVAVTELARARAAGEMQTTERGEPIQIERIQIDEPNRSATRPSTGATTRSAASGRVSMRSADRPQIVRVDGGSTSRTKAPAVGRLDDTQRYREQARYDGEKKQQRKVEITWSAPERQDYRTAHESDESTLY